MKKLDLANENEVIYSDVGTLPFLLLITIKTELATYWLVLEYRI
jgi:hypothetical protein